MSIKVLNVIDSLNAGGAESLLKNFLIETKKFESINIDVCTLYSGGIFEKELKENGIKVFSLNLKFKYNFFGVFPLIRLIKEGRYKIVHAHLFPSDLFVAISSLFLSKGIKLIFSEHSVYNRRRSLKVFKSVDKFTYKRFNKIICVSNEVKRSLNSYLPETTNKSIVIKNAVPVDELKPNKEKIYDILFVGRLEKAKGVDMLLDALGLLKKKYNRSFRTAIVGEGNLKADLENLSFKLELQKKAEFLVVRNDIKDLMHKSSLFVLPSRWEGLPMVILEAMANGIPIISTNVGGIPEVIENGKDGILVSAGDPGALATAILKLFDDEKLKETLIENAYRKVKDEYSIEKYTENMISFYRSLIFL